ncbi:uncharacterized protein A4U43_C04F1680 [Asparagus officinalis]|uniref:Uncharacterized protein n=1 Tax=Asparagus officinalis TaxID=4686 RepID=A0A5P1F270_ASPOF|nr:uncharacterized protein A4U43_C04F1680 [Asparagus officinalis]
MASTGLTRGMPWLRQFMGQRAMSFAATRPLQVIDKAFDNAPKAVATAQEIGGKVKERAQDALSSAKNTK